MRGRLKAMLAAAAFLCVAGAAIAQGQPRQVALLVGISNYKNSGSAPTLDGTLNDVAAMRSALVRRLGVREADIEVLTDAQATKPNILASLRRLEQRSSRGDHVIVYFSGHGTSRLSNDSEANAAVVPYGSGAFITWEYSPDDRANGIIVGRTEMQPIIRRLEEGGRSLFVVYDSCFSGNAVRSIAAIRDPDELDKRLIPERFATDGSQVLHVDRPREASPRYPYRNTVFIGAASEGEVARDISGKHLARYPTVDGKAHGAFTDALLRVLEGDLFADYDHNGQVDYAELTAAIQGFMAARGYGHTPQRLPSVFEDDQKLASHALMKPAGPAAAAPSRITARLLVAADGLPAAVVAQIRAVPGVEVVGMDHPSPDLKLVPGPANASTTRIVTGAGDLVSSFTADTPPREWLGRIAQLSWHKRVRTLGEQGRRGLLKAEIRPNEFGGSFKEGEELWFVASTEAPARLLLLNTDSLGKVSVLYPTRAEELAPSQAGRPFSMPGENQRGIRTEKPYGMDMQLLFAFDQDWPELRQLMGLQLQAGDARLRTIEQLLAKAAGKFTMAASELRVLPRSAGDAGH
jgi:uncharacterized caspase-like protein